MHPRVSAEFKTRHRKWPLGTIVRTKTPQGYLEGRVIKHWRPHEYAASCSVEFKELVDMGDGYPRYCPVIPFRNLRKICVPVPFPARRKG